MQLFRYGLAAGLALALAGPVAAQETETPAEVEPPAAEAPTDAPAEAPPTEQPAAEAPEAPAGAAPGAVAPPAGAAGDPAAPEILEMLKEVFDDWEVRCAPEGDECFMYQLGKDEEGNPVAEVSLLKLPEEADAPAGMTIVTPLGTLLPRGVLLQIDGGEQRAYPFAWCTQVGCFARFPLTEAELQAMKRGTAGKITLVSIMAPDRPVTVDVSLKGFTRAYDSLEVPTLPAQEPAAPAAATPAAPAAEAPAN